MGISQLQSEILEQPAALQRLLESETAKVHELAEIIRRRSPCYVMLAARGSSDNAARYGQYLFGARNHLAVGLAAPSLFTLYQSPPSLKEALVLAVSQSGQSPDICAVVEKGREQGALTVAVTNDPASPLATLAEHKIDLNAGAERSVAATKTYTASLLVLAMLSAALSGKAEEQQALQGLPASVARALEQAHEIISAAAAYRRAKGCVVLGRGYNYSTAFEIALKMKELTYLLAEPYSTADFMHGPVALVQNGFLVVAVVADGRPAEELINLLGELKQRRAQLVVLSPLDSALALADTPIALPAGIPEWLSPVVAVTPGQVFAYGLSRARGIDPDQPRGLHKITLTR
jgi:glucosamine--fructose-6-phosphate aminotransferase (isomerizing)